MLTPSRKKIRSSRLGTQANSTGLVNDVALASLPVLPRSFTTLDARQLSVLGDAPKVVLQEPGGSHPAYIAKAPRREGPRECVTEYLIGEIGRVLPLRVAQGAVVRCAEWLGPVEGALDASSRNFCSVDVRFLSKFFLAPNEELVHGAELVASTFDMEAQELRSEVHGRRAERTFYTVGLIDKVLEAVAQSAEAFEQLRDDFAAMMTFDAIVGANDRHPQNWGVIRNVFDAHMPLRFAPVFDSARGLFWNIPDERLRAWQRSGVEEEQIASYAHRSTPLIGVEGFEDPNHFDVLQHMYATSSRGFDRVIRRTLLAFSERGCAKIVHGSVGRYLSPLRLKFIVDLLRYRYCELRRRLEI